MPALQPAPGACFHCGLPIEPGVDLTVAIEGVDQPMCCPGCRAVAELIVAQGLLDYYRHRVSLAPRADDDLGARLQELEIFDDDALQAEFVSTTGETRSASLSIEGITCAACVWLIERQLRRHEGVVSATVNLAGRRARVVWDPEQTPLSALLFEIDRLGYRARPFEPDRHEAIAREEERRALRRLGIAGLGMGQVMMFAVALYAGAWEGMAPAYRELMRWVSWLVATGVVLTAGRPFFEGAIRDLRARAPGMDVPVALAIGGAYLASFYALLSRSGEVYFDSVCMFTFFLSLARYLELRIRIQSNAHLLELARRVPQVARRESRSGEIESVPVRALHPGDRVRVAPGETIPADGLVVDGQGSVSESLLTGEFEPRAKRVGDRVLAGSQNVDGALTLRVERAGTGSALTTILGLLDQAQGEKPGLVSLADRVARHFVTAVILVSVGVALYWWQHAPGDAFWITLSVLVATCPCALSVATPAALAAATNGLAGRGFLITRGHVLEVLPDTTHVIFDKTGTLTTDRPRLEWVFPIRAIPVAEVLAIARVLEEPSRHPVARAIVNADRDGDPNQAIWLEALRERANDLEVVAGCGVRGGIDGKTWWLGSPAWVRTMLAGNAMAESEKRASLGGGASVGELTASRGASPVDGLHDDAPPNDAPPNAAPPNDAPPNEKASWLLLADRDGPVAWLGLVSELRADAHRTIAALQKSGVETLLVSGDPTREEVARIASMLGIEDPIAGASPKEKLAVIEKLQASGAVVAAVGDGVNDAPLLGRAHVSIAMGSGADLARTSADAVLISDGLAGMEVAVRWARKTRRIIRQNLGWAIAYNLTVLPLAACGWVPPWAAAIGMSLSSLGVVANALRLANVGGAEPGAA